MPLNIYCVILNWNLVNDTIACIDSLIGAGFEPDRIILIDNGSTDRSADILESRYKETGIHLIKNQENLGFAAGSNQGIQYALAQSAGWVFLLNNDTIVAPDALNELTEAVEQNQDYACFGPLVLEMSRPDRIAFLAEKFIPGTLFTRPIGKGQQDRGQFTSLIQTDFLNGCAMLIQRVVFETVGLFNPTLFMYGEEIDLCMRATLSGFRLAAVPKARIWHRVSASADKEKIRTRFLRTRNQIFFYRRYTRGLLVLPMFILTCLKLLQTILFDLFRKRTDLLFPTLQGWTTGWFAGLPDQI